MALVPMKQEILVVRGGELDDWGNPLPEQEFTHNCRVDEGTFLVKSRSGSGDIISSKEVVAEARILLDKLVDIRYGDVISYTNELEEEISGTPEKINIKRHINGKPLMTEVYI